MVLEHVPAMSEVTREVTVGVEQRLLEADRDQDKQGDEHDGWNGWRPEQGDSSVWVHPGPLGAR